MAISLSFRARIVLLVLLVALVPLGLVGMWLAWGTTRSGEALLEARLATALNRTVEGIASHWLDQRAKALRLAEDQVIRAMLAAPAGSTADTAALLAHIRDPASPVHSLSILDRDGQERWAASTRSASSADAGAEGHRRIRHSGIAYRIPVYEGLTDHRLGTVEAWVDHEAVLPLEIIPPEAAVMVLALFDQKGESLRPLPFDPFLLTRTEFEWGGDRWITLRRDLHDPPVRLVAASPMTPILGPFQRATSQGTAMLALVALVGLAAAVMVSRRLTGSLERLSEAAVAISAGDFGRHVDDGGHDEVGRVATAFNTMAESLEETLDELARKESLAAVGEFAASLAHEVRNPLTAVRVDLQKALAGVEDDSVLRAPLERSLAEIQHLSLTIDDTLAHARIAKAGADAVDLGSVLRAAATASLPFFEGRGATLSVETGPDPLRVRGDGDALRKVFLNLFRNAAEALGPGGRAEVVVLPSAGTLEVMVADTGSGIPEELLDRVFEPLFTTRSEGTGLGLTLVKKITEAHGGTVSLDSSPGGGTRVHVRLPRS